MLRAFIAVFSNCGEQGLLPSCRAWASHCTGSSCCRAWAVGHKGFHMWRSGLVIMAHKLQSRGSVNQLRHTALVALWHVGSSQTRIRTCVSCIDKKVLYHWATKEAPKLAISEENVLHCGFFRTCYKDHEGLACETVYQPEHFHLKHQRAQDSMHDIYMWSSRAYGSGHCDSVPGSPHQRQSQWGNKLPQLRGIRSFLGSQLSHGMAAGGVRAIRPVSTSATQTWAPPTPEPGGIILPPAHSFKCVPCCLCGYLSSLWNDRISPGVFSSGKS